MQRGGRGRGRGGGVTRRARRRCGSRSPRVAFALRPLAAEQLGSPAAAFPPPRARSSATTVVHPHSVHIAHIQWRVFEWWGGVSPYIFPFVYLPYIRYTTRELRKFSFTPLVSLESFFPLSVSLQCNKFSNNLPPWRWLRFCFLDYFRDIRSDHWRGVLAIILLRCSRLK